MEKAKKIRRICLFTGLTLSALGYALEFLAKIDVAVVLVRLGLLAVWIAWYMPGLMKSDDPRKPKIAWICNGICVLIILLGGIFILLSNPATGYLLINASTILAFVVWFATKLNEPVC